MSLQANPDCQHPGEAHCTCKDVGELRSSELLAAWHARLQKLARERGVAWMICPDPETHREAFEDGLTIEEELSDQIDAARRSS